MANETNAQGLRPARRTIVKGAAWAVPAIAVAAPAAHAAASTVFEVTGVTVGCKFSSSNVYHLEIRIENTGTEASTISGVMVTGRNSSGNDLSWPAILNQCMCPGDVWVLVINSAVDPNAASFGAQISWAGQTPQALSIPENTPDCNSVKEAEFEHLNTASTATWIKVSGAACAECD